MKKECAIVQDLLALYEDDCLQEESRKNGGGSYCRVPGSADGSMKRVKKNARIYRCRPRQNQIFKIRKSASQNYEKK